MKFPQRATVTAFLYYITKLIYSLLGAFAILVIIVFFVNPTLDSLQLSITVDMQSTSSKKKDLQRKLYNYVDIHKEYVTNDEIKGGVKLPISYKSDFKLILAGILGYISYIIFTIIGLYLLSEIFKTIIVKDPFSKKNSTYFFAIGWLLTLKIVLGWLYASLLESYIGPVVVPDGFKVAITTGAKYYFFAALFVFAISYVFREGNSLQKEQDLTI